MAKSQLPELKVDYEKLYRHALAMRATLDALLKNQQLMIDAYDKAKIIQTRAGAELASQYLSSQMNLARVEVSAFGRLISRM